MFRVIIYAMYLLGAMLLGASIWNLSKIAFNKLADRKAQKIVEDKTKVRIDEDLIDDVLDEASTEELLEELASRNSSELTR